MALVKRDSSNAVDLLLNELLLKKRFRFVFVFKKLPIAPFADLWPGHTPKNLFLV